MTLNSNERCVFVVLAASWVVGVAVGVPMGFIIILLVVIIIVKFVRRSAGTESGENRGQPNLRYEEVGLTPTFSKNQSVTQDVPVKSAEYETTSPQATLDDHVYEKVTKQTEQPCYENTSTIRNRV